MKHGLTKLTMKFIQKAGRNSNGQITVYHRGGGNKKVYKIVDFKRSLFGPARVVRTPVHDPNRTAKLA